MPHPANKRTRKYNISEAGIHENVISLCMQPLRHSGQGRLCCTPTMQMLPLAESDRALLCHPCDESKGQVLEPS